MTTFKQFNTSVLTFEQIDALTDVGAGIVDIKSINCGRHGYRYRSAISMFDIVRSNNYHVHFCVFDQHPEFLSREQYCDTEELLYEYCKRLIPMIENCEKLSIEGVEKYPGKLLDKAHEFFKLEKNDYLDRKSLLSELSEYCSEEIKKAKISESVINEYINYSFNDSTYLQSFALDAIYAYMRLEALKTVRLCLRAKNSKYRGVTDIMKTMSDSDVVFERHYHGYKLMQYMHKWDIDP